MHHAPTPLGSMRDCVRRLLQKSALETVRAQLEAGNITISDLEEKIERMMAERNKSLAVR